MATLAPTDQPTPLGPSPAAKNSNAPTLLLYSTPRSNFAARVRYLARRKCLTDAEFGTELPRTLGGAAGPPDLEGIKGERFLQYNPVGKIPLLVARTDDGDTVTLFESSVICEYVIDRFRGRGPSFEAATPELRAKARLVAAALDHYVSPWHSWMYLPMPGDRAATVDKMRAGFDAVEHALHADGPYAAGPEVTIADCCLWGNWAFYEYMLPTFFGWSPLDGRPKLARWRRAMARESEAARETFLEVWDALHVWWDNDHWQVRCGMEPLTGRPVAELQ